MIDFPHGRHATQSDPILINTNWLKDHRDVLMLLKLDAFDLAQRGDADGALQSAHAAFHCGCSIGDEPMTMAQLVRTTCQSVALHTLKRVLAQAEPAEELLTALQRRIEESESETNLLIMLRGERAAHSFVVEALSNGTIRRPGAGPGGVDWTPILMRVPGVTASKTAVGIRHLNELIEIAKQPPESWTEQLPAQQSKANSLPVLARMSAAPFGQFAPMLQRNHAMQRSAISALAAERFRKKNNRWPASLDELKSAGLLQQIPTDPFIGGNLKMKRTDDGLIFYSVGQDLNDDGGKLEVNKLGNEPFDLGFQLWDVAKRRQPPPPVSKAAEDSPPP
jgi:hypothetical protein